MKLSTLLLLFAGCVFAQTNSVTIYEVDATAQTNRVTTFGRAFKQGEVAACAQPVIGGSALDTSHYQVDVRNRWPDGSLKFAVISILHSLSSSGSAVVTFQNTSNCDNSGYLDQAGMVGFNSGNWGAAMEVTANGVTKTVDARAMLAALAITDCQIAYTLQGPLVTEARVQDCTAATSYDFGAHWDGTAMNMTGGAWYTGNSVYAGLHPVWVLRFVPATASVRVEYVLENSWSSNRMQDQVYSLVLKAGSPLSQVYTSAGQAYATAGTFTHHASSNWTKTFWSGPAPGHIRIDHNFRYLIATRLFPNYDLTKTVDPTADYAAYASSDKGDINGFALLNTTWADNSEGAPLQREDLEYLYNMGSCGVVNSPCAKAWAILTGEVDANPANALVGLAGGGGLYGALMNANTHRRESSTEANKYFYCPARDTSKDAVPATVCGGSVPAFGRVVSKDSGTGYYPPVGTIGTYWAPDKTHWLDFTYVHYLLAGDAVTLQEVMFAGAWESDGLQTANIYWSGGPWLFNNPLNELRGWIWPVLQYGRSALLAPDGSVEQLYFTSRLNTNLAVMEGMMNLTGTALTPPSVNHTCTNYVNTTANRWDWGRCTYGQAALSPLHDTVTGASSSGYASDINTTKACFIAPPYHNWWGVIGLSTLYESGLSQTQPLRNEIGKGLIERVLDPSYNPYLIALYEAPLRNGPGCAQDSTNPYISSYAALKDALTDSSGLKTVATFNATSFLGYPCTDHGYSLLARAAGTFLGGVDSGSFTGPAAWAWLNANVPYFSSGCGSSDAQIKFALAPRPEVTVMTDSLPYGIVGTSYTASLVARGQEPYTWTLVAGNIPNGLSLSSGGTIGGMLNGPAATSSFTVQVQDALGLSTSKTLSIAVYDPLTITTAQPPPGMVGVPYAAVNLISGGGAGNNVWSIVSGSLPSGLSLLGTGAITGSPLAPQAAAFTVRVTDGLGNMASKSLSLLVTLVPGLPAAVRSGLQAKPGSVVR